MKHTLLLCAIVFGLETSAQTILGVDVSSYQGTIDWTEVKSPGGKTFAIAKATEGVGLTDGYYIDNVTQGNTAGVVMGSYHFAHPETNTAAAEAAYFLSVAQHYIGNGYLPPALDLEDPPGGTALTTYFTSDSLTKWVQQWMTAVQNATGVKPMLYIDGNTANYLNSSLNTYYLWTADPDGSTGPPNPLADYLGNWTTWTFKQYSWTGTVSGISGTADEDLDVFNGTMAQFTALITTNTVTPAFTSNVTSVCVGGQVTYTDQSTSTGTINAHKWTFQDGSPSTSTAASPVVTYNTAGTFEVKEVVTSTTGIDSLTISSYIHVIPSSTLPLVETFQSSTFPPTGWTMNFPQVGDSAWELCTYNGYSSSQCMYFPANCGVVNDIAGQRQQIYTPDYSFATTTSAKMWFDVAYEPYNSTYSDTLAVYYSINCGDTWTLVYLKGGMTLCTTGTTIAATNTDTISDGCFSPPNTQAWRTDSINLSAIDGDASVMFSFESRSGWGNIIYIDNINVASTAACTPPAVPTVTAVPGTTGCGSVQLTASSSGCTGCTYNWSNNATSNTVTVTSTGTYYVTATEGSCSSSPASAAITVNQPPSVSAGSSLGQSCINQPVTLTATGNATSYQWSGTGLQASSGSSVNAVLSSGGPQTYTVTATLNSCTATASTTVNFTAAVIPAINISQTTSNPVCSGSQVSFNATSTNGGTNPVYQWVASNNQTGTGSNFTLNNAANGTTVRCLLISDANCASPDSVYSVYLTVTTQTPQPVTLSISTPDTNVCSGENIAFTASSTNGGNSPSYNWYVNGSSVANGPAYTLNNIQGNSEVYCVMTSSSSCVTGSPVTSNLVEVHIQATAQASISISASSNPVCAGAPVTFTATPGNGGSLPVYTWQLNGNTAGANSPVYVNSNLQNGDAVLCSITSSASCVSNPNVVSNTLSIQVNPLPVADAGAAMYITSSSSAAIGGNPSASGGTSPYNYLWSPDIDLSSDTVANPTVSGLTSGTVYTLTVTDANGCSASDTVSVYLISCSLTAPAVQANLCDLAAQNIPAVAYQWYLQNSIITGATMRFYSASATGYYYVVINDSVGCRAQSNDVFVNYPACLTSGIIPVSGGLQFDIYPTPANSEITVSFASAAQGNVQIEIFDLLGQSVYSKTDVSVITGFTYTINTNRLANGSYLLRVTNSDDKFAVKPFIKM